MLRRLFKFGAFRRSRFGISTLQRRPLEEANADYGDSGEELDADAEEAQEGDEGEESEDFESESGEDGEDGEAEQQIAVDPNDVEEREDGPDEEEESLEVKSLNPWGLGYRDVKCPGSRLFLFDSVAQLTQMMDQKFYAKRLRDFGRHLPTLEAFKEGLNTAWTEGLDQLDECVRRLEDAQIPELKDHTRRVRFKDEGDDFDYDRFRSGQDYWRSAVREDSEGPAELTMFIDLTAAWHVPAVDVLWRGAAAIAMAEILERKGYRLEIWVVSGSTTDGMERSIIGTNLKLTSDPLDRSSLINAVSAWFYRLGYFNVRDVLDEKLENKTYEHHYIATPTASDLDQISRDQNRIYSSGCFSFDGALAMMASEIEKLGRHDR